jgi:hypothetical protein
VQADVECKLNIAQGQHAIVWLNFRATAKHRRLRKQQHVLLIDSTGFLLCSPALALCETSLSPSHSPNEEGCCSFKPRLHVCRTVPNHDDLLIPPLVLQQPLASICIPLRRSRPLCTQQCQAQPYNSVYAAVGCGVVAAKVTSGTDMDPELELGYPP